MSKEFTLNLHFVSSRLPKALYGVFSDTLHPNMQALYKLECVVEDDLWVGMRFNVKKPVEISGKLKKMQPNQVKISHLRKNIYLYLPAIEARAFGAISRDARIRCKLEDNWLKLYYPKRNWGRTLEEFFGKNAQTYKHKDSQS